MERKNIDTMQKVRLQIEQIAIMQIPGVREGIGEKIQQTKELIARKFRKESR